MMGDDNAFDVVMLEAAEAVDRKLGPARIAQLRESYLFFKSTGLTDEEIKEVMALTGHEMGLIRKLDKA